MLKYIPWNKSDCWKIKSLYKTFRQKEPLLYTIGNDMFHTPSNLASKYWVSFTFTLHDGNLLIPPIICPTHVDNRSIQTAPGPVGWFQALLLSSAMDHQAVFFAGASDGFARTYSSESCCRRKGENGHSQVKDVKLQDRGIIQLLNNHRW